MPRANPSHSKRAPTKTNRTPAPSALPPSLTPDPAVAGQIRRLLWGFVLRTLALFVLVAVITSLATVVGHLPQRGAQIILFASIFGVTVPFWRGLDRVARRIQQRGHEFVEARRYADGRVALEFFHRVGNMGLDRDGEAHFDLVRAHIGLGDLETAETLADWLTRHRPKSKAAAKAQNVLQAARKTQPPLPASSPAAEDAELAP